MIILDIEASGLNPEKNSLVSIGAIDFENPERQFYEVCRVWDGAHIEDEALAVNGFSREEVTDPKKKSEAEITAEFLEWLHATTSDLTIAGQNPFLDVAFIQVAAARGHTDAQLSHRIIDQHSICWYHMKKRGIAPPLKNRKTDLNSDAIMHYVGIPPEPRPHIALNGAKWEAEAFSRLLNDRSLFTEFEKYLIPWK